MKRLMVLGMLVAACVGMLVPPFWAAVVDAPAILALVLVLVVVLVIAFTGYAGVTSAKPDRSRSEPRGPGAQV